MEYVLNIEELSQGTLEFLTDYCISGVKGEKTVLGDRKVNKTSFFRFLTILLSEKLRRQEIYA